MLDPVQHLPRVIQEMRETLKSQSESEAKQFGRYGLLQIDFERQRFNQMTGAEIVQEYLAIREKSQFPL